VEGKRDLQHKGEKRDRSASGVGGGGQALSCGILHALPAGNKWVKFCLRNQVPRTAKKQTGKHKGVYKKRTFDEDNSGKGK